MDAAQQPEHRIDVEAIPRSIDFEIREGGVSFSYIDERLLPGKLAIERTSDWRAVLDAVASLAVRGAPALGVSGAAALALWANEAARPSAEGDADADSPATSPDAYAAAAAEVAEQIASARPTAVNLRWGTERALALLRSELARTGDPASAARSLTELVRNMEDEDVACNRAIGAHGAALLGPASRILTHCNAGSLGTVHFGTALGIVYTAAEQGRVERVYADETRPVGQGARLTTWELARAGVPVTLICDDMAASLMARGDVDAVIVGADRIAANGDVANKIGTYGIAVLAKHHGLPFYVAAPVSSVDLSIQSGADIPIEQRDPSEVASSLPEGVAVWNPAFDVTPASLVTAVVTEAGVFDPADVADAVEAAAEARKKVGA